MLDSPAQFAAIMIPTFALAMLAEFISGSIQRSHRTKRDLLFGLAAFVTQPILTGIVAAFIGASLLQAPGDVSAPAVNGNLQGRPSSVVPCVRVSTGLQQHPRGLVRDLAEGLEVHAVDVLEVPGLGLGLGRGRGIWVRVGHRRGRGRRRRG